MARSSRLDRADIRLQRNIGRLGPNRKRESGREHEHKHVIGNSIEQNCKHVIAAISGPRPEMRTNARRKFMCW
jgi:hypothetical protein